MNYTKHTSAIAPHVVTGIRCRVGQQGARYAQTVSMTGIVRSIATWQRGQKIWVFSKLSERRETGRE